MTALLQGINTVKPDIPKVSRAEYLPNFKIAELSSRARLSRCWVYDEQGYRVEVSALADVQS